MKTAIILHVILMTIATNIAMDITLGNSVDIPTNPNAEEMFFFEFDGVHEATLEMLNQTTRRDLNFDYDEQEFLKNHILWGHYAAVNIVDQNCTLEFVPVLDKLATDNNPSFRRVESLCIATTTIGGRVIGYRRSSYHAHHVYAFAHNYRWNNLNPPQTHNWPMKVLDLIPIPVGDVAPAAK